MSCAETEHRKVTKEAQPGQNKFLTCTGWLMGQHMGYCDPHTAPGPAREEEEHNQDLGISWAWHDGPFKPKGRGKREIMQGKLDNDTRGQLVVYCGKGYGRCWVTIGRK